MDIHKAKPWHGVRELLKEIGTIVIGVLIALGAEQAVEWLHWADKVERGKAAEVVELRLLYNVSFERQRVERCLDARLASLTAALIQRDGAWRPLSPMVHPDLGALAYVAPSRNWPDEVWKTLVADGTASRLKDTDELRYMRVYSGAVFVREQNLREASDVDALRLLALPTVLTQVERNQLAAQVENLRGVNHRLAQTSRQMMANIDAIVPIDRRQVQAWFDARSNVARSCGALGLDQP